MKTITTGLNRTGASLSPIDARSLTEATESSQPSAENGHRLSDEREALSAISETIGSIPPPTTLKGVAGAVVEKIQGHDLPSFIDRMAERLAFERSGTRLYDALLAKARAEKSDALPELERFRDEELGHFQMLTEAMESLGADPTAVTPSADVSAVMSQGVLQVRVDPRTTFEHALQAILVAELVDNDGWRLLIDMAEVVGREDLAERFRAALAEEVVHLEQVRGWVSRGLAGDQRQS